MISIFLEIHKKSYFSQKSDNSLVKITLVKIVNKL